MPYYNSTGQALSESQDSGVLKRSYQYFASSETMTDSLGRTTVYFSTQTQNLLKPLQIQDPLGNTSAFSYDSDGNRVSMATPDGTNVYSYDPLNRLITAAHPTPSNLPVLNESFSYDPVGNRLADAQISGYNYNAANELVSNSSFTYSYDANGNLISKTDAAGNKTIFSYDSQNELIGASMPSGVSAVYKYDALGRRIFKSTGSLPSQTQQFIYDNQNILAILDGNNNLIALFTHGPGIDEPLEIRQGNGTEYFLHADGLGSIVAATDINGNLVEKIEYESYGQPVFLDVRGPSPVIESQSFTQSPFAFTGREWDEETGLYDNRARYYDPQSGRFTTQDPLSIFGGINYYQYALNIPTKFTDPLGLSVAFFDPCNGLLAIISLGTLYEFPAQNITTGGYAPIPAGIYSVGPPRENTGGRTGYIPSEGPYFIPINVPGRTGIGIHGGRMGPSSPTHGCIRTTNQSLRSILSTIYDANKDPISSITVIPCK